MDIPELIRISSEQTDLMRKTADMLGLSFLEEGWTQIWLSALDEAGVSPERKLEISQAVIWYNFTLGAPYNCAYVLPDGQAAAGVCRISELNGRLWNDIEHESIELMVRDILNTQERQILSRQSEAMSSISNFRWTEEDAKANDYMYFFAIGVDPDSRSSGAFRRLMQPILKYADTNDLACYLECYSAKTEAIYSHYGFELIKELYDATFETYERCMRRLPKAIDV